MNRLKSWANVVWHLCRISFGSNCIIGLIESEEIEDAVLGRVCCVRGLRPAVTNVSPLWGVNSVPDESSKVSFIINDRWENVF